LARETMVDQSMSTTANSGPQRTFYRGPCACARIGKLYGKVGCGALCAVLTTADKRLSRKLPWPGRSRKWTKSSRIPRFGSTSRLRSRTRTDQ
jgi:hypothetical protein